MNIFAPVVDGGAKTMNKKDWKASRGAFDAVVYLVAAPEKGLEVALKSTLFRAR